MPPPAPLKKLDLPEPLAPTAARRGSRESIANALGPLRALSDSRQHWAAPMQFILGLNGSAMIWSL